MAAEPITIELSDDAYEQLRQRAEQAGKPLAVMSRELLEAALGAERPAPKSAREILEAAGRIRPLGPVLERKIIPGVTHDQVRAALTRAGGPSLSEIVLANRGPKE
jgi:hypothetical protein